VKPIAVRPAAHLLAAAVALVVLAGCGKKAEQGSVVQTAPVTRRDIIVEAEATGSVEPINVVEVKSKASGQIIKGPPETGVNVKPGDLLVQLDTRDVKNQYDQAKANLTAAESQASVTMAQKVRSDTLFVQKIITAQEHETADLAYTNAQAQLVGSRASLDLADQRLTDATVKAPVAGTVIEKDVSLGQVIASATNSPSGGTTLLKMADLSTVRVRAFVNETDIGAVKAGQPTTVTVDAYPDRPFHGTVEKIEPQAVVQQSVTMFPVLITLDNREGLLRPGMNGETAILTERRDAVLSVPNDAVRTTREVTQAAMLLGLNPDTVRKQLQAQFAMMGGGMRGAGAAAADTPSQVQVARGDVALPAGGAQGQTGGGQRGQGGQPLPEVTDKDCAAVTAAFAKHPDAQGQLRSLMDRARSGEIDFAAVRTESEKIYGTLGVKADVARACRMRDRNAAGASAPSGSAGATTAAASGTRAGRGNAAGAGSDASGGMSGRARTGLVFVVDSTGKYAPHLVRLGVANYDYTEVMGGVKEGDQVAILTTAALQQQREAMANRIRGMGGVPGMQRSTTTGGNAGGARRGGP
jgi:HlyD family secretion protein